MNRQQLGESIGIITKAQIRNNMWRIKSQRDYIANHKHSAKLQQWYDLGLEEKKMREYLKSIEVNEV
tara:strand:- start:839 stop:1039 length:201 start_codon:yes stop_codon:yes gene_type:complete